MRIPVRSTYRYLRRFPAFIKIPYKFYRRYKKQTFRTFPINIVRKIWRKFFRKDLRKTILFNELKFYPRAFFYDFVKTRRHPTWWRPIAYVDNYIRRLATGRPFFGNRGRFFQESKTGFTDTEEELAYDYKFPNFKNDDKKYNMPLDQAKEILGITEDTYYPRAVNKAFSRMFINNQTSRGGSFYILSRIYCAKQVIDQDMRQRMIRDPYHMRIIPQESRFRQPTQAEVDRMVDPEIDGRLADRSYVYPHLNPDPNPPRGGSGGVGRNLRRPSVHRDKDGPTGQERYYYSTFTQPYMTYRQYQQQEFMNLLHVSPRRLNAAAATPTTAVPGSCHGDITQQTTSNTNASSSFVSSCVAIVLYPFSSSSQVETPHQAGVTRLAEYGSDMEMSSTNHHQQTRVPAWIARTQTHLARKSQLDIVSAPVL